jgi:hypothetical protein
MQPVAYLEIGRSATPDPQARRRSTDSPCAAAGGIGAGTVCGWTTAEICPTRTTAHWA